jgi:hypothetical protein
MSAPPVSSTQTVPPKSRHNRTLVIVEVIVIVVVAVGVGYYFYQGSLQPNIQVVNLQFGTPQQSPQTSTVQDQGRISSGGSFSYTAPSSGVAYLVFDNSFSIISTKQVSEQYSVIGGSQNSQSFSVPPGTSHTVQVPIYGGQSISGTFTTSGGSGNDVDFSIQLYTCSQTVPFTATLVNSGSANGYAVVSLQIRSSSGAGPLVQNGTVFSNNYYVPQGRQVPISGTATIMDCGSHTLNAVVSQRTG